MTELKAQNISRRLTASIIVIILLISALSVTTFMLVVTTVSTDGHMFSTGNVRLNLNDGKAVIRESDCLIEPGKTIEKSFTVENLSTCDVWYKFYFENVDGELSDFIDIKVKDGETVLLSGKISDLTEENTVACPEGLSVGERKNLTISFHFDVNGADELQNEFISFDFSAKAVQMRNNPDKKFN